ncbi:MAG: response regulator [Cellulomonadaceae bacterium]|nr:response regulator [Cellulomonadaceae bacterium]
MRRQATATAPRRPPTSDRGVGSVRPTLEVLLVEDDPGDVLMTTEAFAESPVPTRLSVVGDGERALAYLRRENGYTAAQRPDLVLLDLNLPRMGGREVLAAMKQDAALASIPVVVLTTSEAEDDVAASYALHANAYVTKPVDFDRFIEVVRRIDDFFVSVARLPRR